MLNSKKPIILRISTLLLLSLSFFSCRGLPKDPTVPTDLATLELATVLVDTPEPIQPEQMAIFVSTAGTENILANQIEQIVSDFAAQNNLAYERRPSLLPEELSEQVRIVIAMAPDPSIAELASNAPQTKFLAIGIDGIQPTDNLFTINNPSGTPGYLGFLAGYTAALITEDWRVGVLNVSDSFEGKLIRESFLIGVRYFCGLCLQAYPPYYDYPLYVELPANSNQNDWRAAADQLRSNSVQTIFVGPGVGDDALLQYLAQAGITILSSTPQTSDIDGRLAASLGVDLTSPLNSVLTQMLTNEIGQNISIAPEFLYTNPIFISPGKIADIKIVRQDLVDGYIYPLVP
ncbi:MAG: hypothetical protein N2C13_04340 [Chloroflexota bacterium]